MAAPIETQGQLQDFLAVLKKRRWQVILPMVFFIALGASIAVIVPRKYLSETKIEVRETRVSTDPTLKSPGGAAVTRELENTVHHIKHPGRVQNIIEQLRWPDYLELSDVDRNEFVKAVIGNIDVEVEQTDRKVGSAFVTIEYTDIDPQRAARFLTRLAESWKKYVANRDIDMVREEKAQLQNELQSIQSETDDLADEITELLAVLGIPWEHIFGEGKSIAEDPVLKMLNKYKEERDDTAAQLAQIRAEIVELEKALAETPPEVPVTTTTEGKTYEEQKLAKQEAIRAKQKKQDRLLPENSLYVRLQEEIEQLEQDIRDIEAEEQESISEVSYEPNPALETLRATIEAQKAEVAGLDARLGELNRLVLDYNADYLARISSVKQLFLLAEEYRRLTERHTEVAGEFAEKSSTLELLTGTAIEPFETVVEARPAKNPEPPNPFVIVAFAGVAGLALGLGAALMGEFSKNSYRSVHDVTRVLSIPVLGVINTIVTSADRRRARARHWTVGVSSTVLIGGLLWFAWAWTSHPEYLPTNFLERIEDVRMMMR